MHLHIIASYYDESQELCNPLFESINNQTGINFDEISLIISSSSGRSSFPNVDAFENLQGRTYFVSIPYKISGPGQSRQAGIDLIRYTKCIDDSDWVLFCDIDDRLYDNESILKIFRKMADTHADVYEFDTQTVWIDKDPTITDAFTRHYTVWGKVYNLWTMIHYDIRFSDKMKSQEDFFFNYCFDAVPDAIKREVVEGVVIYTHIHRDTSTGYTWVKQKTRKDWLDDNIKVWEEFSNWATVNHITPITQYSLIMEGILNVAVQVPVEEFDEKTINVFREYLKITDQQKIEYEQINRCALPIINMLTCR